MKPEDLDRQELKVTFKRVKEQLSQGDKVSDYSLYTAQILSYQEKDTGSALIHYACEFGQASFLAKIKRFQGANFLLEQFKIQSNSGKTPLHILALTADYKMLRKVLKFMYRQGEKVLFNFLACMKDQKDSSLPIHMLLMNNRSHNEEIIVKAFRVMHRYWQLIKFSSSHLDMYLIRNKLLDYPLELVVKKGYKAM